MYKIYADDLCIYNDAFTLDDMIVTDPKLTLSDSNAGSFTFKLPPTNKGYDLIQRMTTKIRVIKDDIEIWEGRVLSEKIDFWNCRSITCEGELAYLNDSTQPPAEYHDQTVRGFLETLIRIHNSKVSDDKKFTVGQVTVTDPNDSLYRYTNYEKTIECINDKLIKSLGGHLRIRKSNGIRYLDYLADYPNTNSQKIEFGKNLLDFTKSFDMSDFATVIVPKGARLDESPIEALEAYLTVESVNGGSIYVKSDSAIKSYGWIEKVVSWDNVTVASTLLSKAKKYLSELQFDSMVIELSAIDLHYMDIDVESVSLLDEIRVISKPHGLDRLFPVTKLVIPLDKPENATYTLGDTVKMSLTQSNNSTNTAIIKQIAQLPTAQSVLKEAKENATQIMNSAVNGYITIEKGTNGTETLYISNTQNVKNATKLWKWNLNGLGYSKDGGKTWGTAITMDGAIVADYITTGTLNADLIKTGTLKDKNSNTVFNLSTGELTIKKGSINIGSGKFSVSASGYLTSTSGKIGGFNISSYSIYNDIISLSSTGLKFMRDNYNIGTFGTNVISGHSDQRGLVMDIEKDCNYITWAARTGDSGQYMMKLSYINQDTSGFNNTGRLYLGCPFDGNNYTAYRLLLDPDSSGAVGGITGTINFVQVLDMESDGTVGRWSNNCSMTFKRGMLVSGRWYKD